VAFRGVVKHSQVDPVNSRDRTCGVTRSIVMLASDVVHAFHSSFEFSHIALSKFAYSMKAVSGMQEAFYAGVVFYCHSSRARQWYLIWSCLLLSTCIQPN